MEEEGESTEAFHCLEVECVVTTRTVETLKLPRDGEVSRLLTELYKHIWLEACYDPDTLESQKFCREKLLNTNSSITLSTS